MNQKLILTFNDSQVILNKCRGLAHCLVAADDKIAELYRFARVQDEQLDHHIDINVIHSFQLITSY